MCSYHQKLRKLNSEVIKNFFTDKMDFCSEKSIAYLVLTSKSHNYVVTKFFLSSSVIITYTSNCVFDLCLNYFSVGRIIFTRVPF